MPKAPLLHSLSHGVAHAPPAGHPTPGHRVVALLGGVRATAALAGRDRVQVYRWLKPRARGGLGGRVPPAVQEVIVRKAADAGVDLALADFLPQEGEAFL